MTDEPEVLAQRMVSAMERWQAARRCSAEMQELRQRGLSLSHVRVLHELAPDHRLGMKALAERLRITPPSLTGLMGKLEREGLVVRMVSDTDQRRALVGLTADGAQLIAALQHARHHYLARLLSGLAPHERITFIELLERAVAQQ